MQHPHGTYKFTLILQTLDQIALVMNDYPLLWVVYGFTILLPVVGAIACCFWPKVRGLAAINNNNIHSVYMNICFLQLGYQIVSLCCQDRIHCGCKL